MIFAESVTYFIKHDYRAHTSTIYICLNYTIYPLILQAKMHMQLCVAPL